jgi:hypothetical protein
MYTNTLHIAPTLAKPLATTSWTISSQPLFANIIHGLTPFHASIKTQSQLDNKKQSTSTAVIMVVRIVCKPAKANYPASTTAYFACQCTTSKISHAGFM